MRLVCVLILFLLPFASAASVSVFDYDIKHWTSNNGLSSNSVRAVTQDQQGFLWFGTLHGLQRFDGEQFEVFTTERFPQLASNTITQLFTDSLGNIWIGTKAGLSVFDPLTWQFQRLPLFNEITSIAEVAPGEIWVAADQLFHIQAGQVKRVDAIKASVSQIAVNGDQIWVAAATELYQGDRDGVWQSFPFPAALNRTPVYQVTVSQQGVYLAAESGLFLLKDNQVIAHPLPDDSMVPVYQMLIDHKGATWISAYRKLFYRYQQEAWQTVTINELGLSPWFAKLFLDQQDQLWLTSISDGILRASVSQIRRIIPGKDPVIRSLALTPQGELLLASQTELGVLSKDETYQQLLSETQLRTQTIQALYWPENQPLWLGTDKGVFRLSEQRLEPLFSELTGQSVRVIQAAQQGGVWIGAVQGLYKVQQDTLQWLTINKELESRQITSLAENERQLIIGTSRGIYRQQAGRLSRLGSGTALYGAYILATLLLPDDTLLVSTLDDGVFIHQPVTGWQSLHSGNGLSHGPAVSFYYHQPSGWIWISTHKGIFRMAKSSLSQAATLGYELEEILSPFDRQMGSLSSRCCNGAGQSKVAFWQQQFWFPTLKGVVAVAELPEGKAEKWLNPQLKYVLANRTYPVTKAQSRLVVDQLERNLQFSYTSLAFSRPETVEFRFRLQGFEQDWQTGGNSRLAVYTNLPPGQFEFELQAKYRHQQWQDAQSAQLELIIPRRFDETLLYRLLWVLLITGCLYGIFWLYRQNVLSKQDQLTRLVLQRTQELENTNGRLNELNEQLLQLTHRDRQTGLRNQRFLYEQLPKDIEHFQRNLDGVTASDKAMTLLVLKPLMINHGQVDQDAAIPEQQIQQLSTLLIRETRGSDYVIRLEQEHFLVVLRDMNPTEVPQYCQRLLSQLSYGLEQLPNTLPLALHAGFAFYPLPLLGGSLLSWELSLQLASSTAQRLTFSGQAYQYATLLFAEDLVAFEFEETQDAEQHLTQLLADGQVSLQILS